MKNKLTLRIWFSLLILALGIVGLSACNMDDDDLNPEKDVYQGYITQIQNNGYFFIKITRSPHIIIDSPTKNNTIGVLHSDFLDIDLKVGQKLDFDITSTNGAFVPCEGTPQWYCEINILKIE